MDQDHEFLMMLFSLTQAIRFCQQEEICGEAITFTQFNIINLIFQHRSMRMSELHAALAVEKSTTTRLIEPLVGKRLVEKVKSPDDSRVTIVKLTDEGLKVRNRAWECLQGFISSVEGKIPEAKRQEVYEALKLYTTALRDSCCSCHCAQNGGRC